MSPTRFPRLALSAALLAALLGSAVPLRAAGFEGPGPWMVRAWFGDEVMIREVASWGEHFSDQREKGYLLIEADREALGRLRALGFFVEPDEDRARLFPPREGVTGVGEAIAGIPNYPCYRTVEETFASAQALAAAHPDLATVLDSGDSWEKANIPPAGYDMLVLRLTNSAVPGPKPVFFATAAIHAREYVTAETAIRFAEQLLASYGIDPDATWLLDHHEFHLMLHANPDGRKHAELQQSWRKNTNQDYCGPTSSSRGADLNRNFDFYWGAWGGSSGFECDQTYRGAAPASEPETQAIQDYMAQVFVDQRPDDLTTPAPGDTTGVYVDLHSYQPAILTSWGLTSSTGDVCVGSNLPPNCDGLLRLGRKVGRLSAWDPRVGGLYPVDGSTKDHAYGRYGVPAYTWEMGTDFFENCDSFEEAVAGPGQAMLRYALRVARAPYMLTQGPDLFRVEAMPGAVGPGTSVALSAQAADGRVFDEEGGQPEPANSIAEARAYLDVPPWAPGATPIALSAADGAFDETAEELTGTIDTGGLAFGTHLIYVHARDSAGNWGPVSAGFLGIVDTASDPLVQGSVLTAGNALPLAARVLVGPFATETNPATGEYSLRVPAGTWDVAAEAPLHAPRVVTDVVLPPATTLTENFLLPPPVFADDGEGANPGWTAQSPWALRTDVAWSPTHSWSDSLNNYSANANVSLTSPVIDLSDASGVELVFQHLYMLEGSYDYGRVEISTNGGSTWSQAARFSGAVSWDWERVVIPLPALDGVGQARFRFRLTSDTGLERDGWHLDDIALTAVLPPSAPQSLTVSVTGSGTVMSTPPGISCPSDCAHDYPAGTPVVLTATPAPGWSFTGWSGDCSGTGTCNLTMNVAHAVTATFVFLDPMPFIDGFETGDTSRWSAVVP